MIKEIYCTTPIVVDIASGLDLITLGDAIVINKEAFCEDFFKLSTGLAGEILQRFVNYSKKIAIYGDFSGYTSKPLRDFMYECNLGGNIFFTATKNEAIDKVCEV